MCKCLIITSQPPNLSTNFARRVEKSTVNAEMDHCTPTFTRRWFWLHLICRLDLNPPIVWKISEFRYAWYWRTNKIQNLFQVNAMSFWWFAASPQTLSIRNLRRPSYSGNYESGSSSSTKCLFQQGAITTSGTTWGLLENPFSQADRHVRWWDERAWCAKTSYSLPL